MTDTDIIVVGAGPAGSCAAIAAAKAGKRVVLIERGPFPGSKNMYGGVIYPRILDELIPDWYEHAPIQRWVVRRSTMLLSDTGALNIDYRSNAWGQAPYNGATAYRPDFDNWLAQQAVAAGAELICSTTVTGLLRDAQGRITGITTDRPDGDLTASVVIACDGVNSFVAKEAGVYKKVDASNYTLGVKETLSLPKSVIDERFGVRDNQGVDIEILGGTSGVNGGGFLYTNLDTIALGVVLKLPKLSAQKKRPEEIIAELKRHPAIAPLIEGAEVTEYSAHVIPEAGLDMMPTMVADGLLIAGDAAALCLAAGIWLEGVNFAMASGMYAGEAAAKAIQSGNTSASGLQSYTKKLNETFVLKDHKKLRKIPHLVLSDRVQHKYPMFVTGIVERMFSVENPHPKPGVRRIVREERKKAGIKLSDLLRDALTGLKGFG
ncbi:MAG: FAD-dependent oxidoreductase [Ilumatobacteraceae bacterium]|nr:FAD-dependent oxidoreductase [Ilumatobacteraceae bacterium]MDP4936777.1 FAD-dependent oxidoreductase [Ilumatobacteraceae bacterium]